MHKQARLSGGLQKKRRMSSKLTRNSTTIVFFGLNHKIEQKLEKNEKEKGLLYKNSNLTKSWPLKLLFSETGQTQGV